MVGFTIRLHLAAWLGPRNSTQSIFATLPTPALPVDRATRDSCRRCSSILTALRRSRTSGASRDRVAIASHAFKLQAQPVIASPDRFCNSTGAAPLLPISTSNRPSLLKSPTASPRAGYVFVKAGPASAAYVVQLSAVLMKQEQRLFVFHRRRVVFNHGRRGARWPDRNRTVVIVIEKTSVPSRSATASTGPRHSLVQHRGTISFFDCGRARTSPGPHWRQTGPDNRFRRHRPRRRHPGPRLACLAKSTLLAARSLQNAACRSSCRD